MKRLSAVLVALLLAATAAVTVFAAGITSAEQAVLDNAKAGVITTEDVKYLPDSVVNQFENYLNTVDLTDEQANQLLEYLNEGKKLFASFSAANIPELTKAQKQQLMDVLVKAADVVDATVTFSKPNVTVTDKDGNVLLIFEPVLVSASSNGGNDGVIKTTGADFSTVTFAIAGAAVLLIVAGGALYIVKSKKA